MALSLGIGIGMPFASAPGGGFAGPLDSVVQTVRLKGAFTLYKLPFAAGYGQPCIRLRRSSDSAESDFGFVQSGADCVLDTAAISSWAGASTLWVRYWYDVSGAGNHLDQSTAGSQPQFFLTGGPSNLAYVALSGKTLRCAEFGNPGGGISLAQVWSPGGSPFLRAFGLLASGGGEHIIINTRGAATENYVQYNNIGTIGPNANSAAGLWRAAGVSLSGTAGGAVRVVADANATAGVATATINYTHLGTASAGSISHGAFFLATSEVFASGVQDSVQSWLRTTYSL